MRRYRVARQCQQRYGPVSPQQVFGVLGPDRVLGGPLAVERLAEIPEVLGSVPPIDNLGPLATKARRHFVPNPLRPVTEHHDWPQDRLVAATILGASTPADHIQRSASGGLGAQTSREGRCLLPRRHVAGRLQVCIGPTPYPTTHHAQLDLVPRAPVWPTIAIAHQYPIRLDHQRAWRRLVRPLARAL